MVYNQDKFRFLPLVASEIVKDKRREKQKKTLFRDNFFYFQIFRTFGNLDIGFSIKLNKCV